MKTFKKLLVLVLSVVMLSVSVAAIETKSLIEPSSMTDGTQVTQDAAFKFELITDDAGVKNAKLYLDEELSTGWGWLIFDEYKDIVSWTDYSGMLVRLTNISKNEMQFGLNGMASGGQTARIELSQSGIIAVALDGTDLSSQVTTTSYSGPNPGDWGAGDPSFTVPAGFDGYYILPFDGAFLDDDYVSDDINTMACFLFGENSGSDNAILIKDISIYKGTTDEMLTQLFPPVVIEEPEIIAETDAPAAEVTTTAPATADFAVILLCMAAVCAFAIKKSIKSN